MLPLLLAALGALATARITRLITSDRLTLPLRRRLLAHVRAGGSLEYLLSCSWCTSIWVGLLVAAGVTHSFRGLASPTTRVELWLLLTLAYSHLTGRWARTEVEA